MLIARFIAFVATTFLSVNIACGQAFPAKTIRIVTVQPGSANDTMARQIAQGISGPLGRSVIVDNRGMPMAAEIVAKAPSDGYTLLFYSDPLWVLPFLRNDVSWNPLQDFLPISSAVKAPNVLVVTPSLPVTSVKELISLAKAKPGELNYGSGSSGSSGHLAGELFKYMANVDIVRIPYQGIPYALTALVGGHVQLSFPTAGSAMPYIKSGQLKALAIGSTEPSAVAPGIPTLAASGLPGYESVSRNGLFAPAKTPVAVINRLNQEVRQVLNTPAVKERFLSMGVEVSGSTPGEFTDAIKAEMARLSKMIKSTGLRE